MRGDQPRENIPLTLFITFIGNGQEKRQLSQSISKVLIIEKHVMNKKCTCLKHLHIINQAMNIAQSKSTRDVYEFPSRL